MRYNETPFGFIMVLEPADELMGCLIRLARNEEVEAAVLNGVGAVRDVELGDCAAHHGLRGPERRHIREPMDACSLTGTISLLHGEPLPHVHAVLSRDDRPMAGGHVYSAVCHGTLEVSIHTSPTPLPRDVFDFRDSKAIRLEEHP